MIQFTSVQENQHYLGVQDIHPQEVAKRAQDLLIIDVRQPEEYVGELSHIVDAQLIVLDELPEQLERLPKDKPILFVCRSGARSARACSYAKSNGFNQVYNLQGGMILWNDCHLPVAPLGK